MTDTNEEKQDIDSGDTTNEDVKKDEQVDQSTDKVELEEGHKYELADSEGGAPQKIIFMKKEAGNLVHGGTTNEEVIAMMIDRIMYLQSKLECHENTVVLDKLGEIKELFQQRTKDRKERGVEGSDNL